MTRKIFSSILSVSVIVLLLCLISISGILYGYFGNVIKKELRTEADIMAQQIEDDDTYLQNMNAIDNRVTLVDVDGKVLFDSQADPADMENHNGRQEIKEARADGDSTVTRYSDTLSTKTIYYAKALPDGKVLRIAQQQSMAALLLKGVVAPFIAILIAIVIIAMILSRMIAKRIVGPINAVDLDDGEAEEPYPELAPLITKVRQQKHRIHSQMEEMEREQKEFKEITENMSEGFLLLDKNLEILSFNKAAIELLGYGDGEAPSNAFELNRSKSFRTAVDEALDGTHAQKLLETEGKCYSIMASPVFEAEDVVGCVVIVVDVTEKEQRDRLRREFTSNVSHELKTPLTTIYGVSDMMAEGIVKPNDVKSFGKNIREESGRMIQLIDDIIQLSRLDEGASMDEEQLPVDLFETAQDVIDRLRDHAKDKGISLYLDGESAVIKGSPALCDEILYNLCENAIKYNKENGSVTITVHDLRAGAELIVEDTGIGIPYEYKDRIFERFFRVDKSHSQTVDGTGLGLSIVKHAVARMGGTIEVDSVEGAGTKMIVRFPRK